MKIKKTKPLGGRDYYAIMVCEADGCGALHKMTTGYADTNFDQHVIPAMKCRKCGESTNSLAGVPNAAHVNECWGGTLTESDVL